jgi:aminomethyltransferase
VSATTTDLMRTPLYDSHVRAGARMVDFAGWEMPVQYEGVRQEHVAVRTHAGVFDVSHMGEIETRGPRAGEFLRHLLTNDIDRVPRGGAQYSLLCREDGGVLDDLFTYRFPDEENFLTVVNASNAETDFAWFAARAAEWDGVEVTDRSHDYAMIALQGPDAIEILTPLIDGEAPARFRFHDATVAGVPSLVCRTGYTGEDGVELLLAPQLAAGVWDALAGAGAKPAGLGARDTLRLEVCYPLYGNDLSTDRTPIEAALGWACALDKDFIGAERLREQTEQGMEEKLAPFVFTSAGIPRAGCAVIRDGEQVGVGTEIEVDVRGKSREARVASKPLYKKES